MKRVFASAALASFFVSQAAFAEEAKKEEKSLVPYGIIQAKYYLHESSRDTGPEALTEFVRAGLRGKFGLITSGMEVQLNGNTSDLTTGSTAGNGTVTVRAAWLGLDLPSKTTIKMGRVRPGYAAGYGTDVTSVPQGYSGVDGVRLSQVIAINSKTSVDFAFGVFNSLRSMAYIGDAGLATKNNMLNTMWNKPEKAFVGNAAFTYDGIKAQAWYGAEKNAVVGASYKTTQGGNKDGSDKQALTALTVADLGHLEASLGFDRDNYGFGIFMERDMVGKKSSATLNGDTGKLEVGAETGEKAFSVTWTGIGANLMSKEFGLTNMLAKDDSLTFGTSYALKQKRTDGSDVTSEQSDDVHQLSASVSYTVNNFDVAFVLGTETSAYPNNTNAKGEPVHSQQKAYINAVWEF